MAFELMEMFLSQKLNNLRKILEGMKSLLVAYSGGVDSTFLVAMAKRVLSGKVLAVTALSPTYPLEDIEEVKKIVKNLQVKHLFIESQELSEDNFVKNPPNRCYYCKKELFTRLKEIAQDLGIENVADGTNYDDRADFRPGRIAAQEFRIRSPLKEAELSKEDVRKISRKFNLSTWDKPASACLASRFPYGTKITPAKLSQVYESEKFLKSLGFTQVRVRHYGSLARIEVLKEEIPLLLRAEKASQVISKFKHLGYNYVTLDLQGYRSGSLNEVLKTE